MTAGKIPSFESKRLRTKNNLPENLVAPPCFLYPLAYQVSGESCRCISVINGILCGLQEQIRLIGELK